MAKIVLGLGCSHTPQLGVPAAQWDLLRKKDETDPRLDYASLLERAKPDIESELRPELMQERDDRCQHAVETLKQRLADAAPDVLLVLGDDQHEQFHEDNMPMFCVYRGATLPVAKRDRARPSEFAAQGMATTWQQAVGRGDETDLDAYPAHPALAGHVIDFLVGEGFDIACSDLLKPEVGVGHAFSFLHKRLLANHSVPIMPMMINTFYPPNAPTAKRCYGLGHALKGAVESWDSNARVAIVASGGLSHVIVDEELDRSLMDALLEKDVERLKSFPADRMTLGTSENRNWIALGGAMEGLDMKWTEYVPAYRSPAGTGCGMGFAYWQ